MIYCTVSPVLDVLAPVCIHPRFRQTLSTLLPDSTPARCSHPFLRLVTFGLTGIVDKAIVVMVATVWQHRQNTGRTLESAVVQFCHQL
jgi:hypothetical protein